TWVFHDIGYGTEMGGIVIDPINPQRLWIYGGPFKGLVRSEDGGLTAVRADTGIKFDHHGNSVMALAYDSRRNILYAGDFAIPFGGIYRSFDGGRHWQQLHRFSDDELQFAPTFYLIEEDSGWVYSASTRNGIWRSEDFGVTWLALHSEVLAGKPVSFIAKVPNSRTMYAVGGMGQVYKSYDLGEHWGIMTPAILDSSLLVGGLLISSLDTNFVYVGAKGGSRDLGWQGGFFLSRDGGDDWELYHSGLPQYELWKYLVRSIAVSTSSTYVYMSLLGATPKEHGVYRLSQSVLTSVQEHSRNFTNLSFTLKQNYPNPFNAQTRIEFSLSRKNLISLAVYSISGEHVVDLFDGQKAAGSHFIIWNGRNSEGCDVGSGIYLFRLKAGTETLTRKLVLIR
ncbi:MAG: T9SS type A sorting domain-containing protein, partial [bacterium]